MEHLLSNRQHPEHFLPVISYTFYINAMLGIVTDEEKGIQRGPVAYLSSVSSSQIASQAYLNLTSRPSHTTSIY